MLEISGAPRGERPAAPGPVLVRGAHQLNGGSELGASQILFFVNFFWSAFKGAKAPENPWNANGLEWTTSSPPPHGNWPGAIPEVHRWPYEYSNPSAPKDFVMQHEPPLAVESGH